MAALLTEPTLADIDEAIPHAWDTVRRTLARYGPASRQYRSALDAVDRLLDMRLEHRG